MRVGWSMVLAPALVAGCALFQPASVSDLVARPAERALLAGWRAYDDARYADAERELSAALAAGLQSGKDQALAHKLLAFVYCTSERPAECERAFRAARSSDPGFRLTRAEAGHPLWGSAYRKAVPE